MSTNVIQPSFSGGELSSSLFAHVDLARYKTGAAIMRNFFVDYRSGASTRPGTKFICQAYDSSKPVRLIPYQFSSSVSFEIEFGHLYCRFIQDGGMVLETDFTITGATQANPVVLTVVGNPWSNNDWIFVEEVGGMVQVNRRFYKVQVAGNSVTLYDVNGVAVNGLDYDAFTTGGVAARVYKIVSPYDGDDLADLKFVQSQGVMTITHPDYAPRELSAASATSWAFTTISFATTVSAPTGAAGSASGAGATNYAYVVTAVDSAGQESLRSNVAAVAAAVNINATAGTITLTWNAVSGASYYNIYKSQVSFTGAVPTGVGFGYVGNATSTSFIDSNIVPDYTTPPPVANNPFSSNNDPIAVCYYQQRLTFGGSDTDPTTFWMSQPGGFHNFNISFPAQDDDSIEGTIVSLQVNAIRWMVPMPGGLIVGTSKGIWQLQGSGGLGSNSAITPADAIAVPQANSGASSVQPLVLDDDVLCIQEKGSAILDLAYNINRNIYSANDISIYSNHLVFNHTISEWAWAEAPYKICWAVRDDGILISLTFAKQQEIAGLSRSDTKGLFKSVSSVTENRIDAVYVVVERYLSGSWVKLIERFDDRMFTVGDYNPEENAALPVPYLRGNAESAWCVDCGIQSELDFPSATITADTNVGEVTFQASAAIFTSADVGKVLRMGGGVATITEYSTTNTLIGEWTISPSKVLPNDPDKTPLPQVAGDWSLTEPFTVMYGLDHLEGETVSILADGGVVTPQVVTNGSVTLATEATLVTVGLKFTADLQTMPLDVGGVDTIQGKRKKLAGLTVKVDNSRGLSAGPTFLALTDIKELGPAAVLGAPIPLISGDEYLTMDPLWSVPGQICIRQENPLPATILGVVPEIVIGDTNANQRGKG